MRRATRARGACLAGVIAAVHLMTAAAVEPAAPAQPPASTPLLTLLQVLAALLVVLAAVWLLAWLARRMLPGRSASGVLKVVGGVMLGPRERLVLVEVGDTWLVVGVAAGSVNLVHTMPRPAGAASVATAPPAALSKLLGDAMRSHKVGG